MANINKIKLSGTTYSIQDENATKTVELTQAQYDALSVKDPNTFYIITDATAGDLSNYYTKSETSGATEISTALGNKQDTLVSGTNIKTINNESILGSGNIEIQGGGSSYTAGDGIDITNDVISVTGKVDTTAFTAHTADTVIHVTSAEKAAWNAKSDFSGSYNDLTNKLSAGTNISIVDNVISAEGGGSITIDPSLDTGSTNAVANSAITNAFNTYTARKNSDNGEVRYFYFPTPSNPWGGSTFIKNFSINGRCPLTQTNGSNSYIDKFSLVETSAITTSVTSSSTDVQVPSAKAVNDKLGGLSIVKLTQSEYDALATKDNSTLYVIVN